MNNEYEYIILEYVCPSLGCIVAAAMCAGERRKLLWSAVFGAGWQPYYGVGLILFVCLFARTQ